MPQTQFDLDQAIHTPGSGSFVSDAELTGASGLLQSNIDSVPRTPRGYIHGLGMLRLDDDSVQVGSGVCRDAENSFDIVSDTNVTVDKTLSGAGGLDTGSESDDTWYAVHIIADSTGSNSPNGLLSLSASDPTLPAGYDKFRRVGWVRVNAVGRFRRFLQIWQGQTRRLVWDETRSDMRVLNGANATTFTEIDLSNFMSPTANNVLLHSEFESGSGGSETHEVSYRPAGFVGAITESLWQHRTADVSTNKSRIYMEVPCVNQAIEYKVDSAANNLVNLSVAGYDDEL